MLKFILILILIFYLVYKLAGFLVRVLVVGAVQERQKQHNQAQSQPQSRKAKGGNVNIDFVPDDPKQSGQIKGGEYVDYEEVK